MAFHDRRSENKELSLGMGFLSSSVGSDVEAAVHALNQLPIGARLDILGISCSTCLQPEQDTELPRDIVASFRKGVAWCP